MRVGILGGTFDPIHLGHLVIAEESRLALALDQVCFLPAGQPWLKEGQPLTAAAHRVAMVELAIAANPGFSLLRNEVDRPGPSYTVDTLEELGGAWGSAVEPHFILGVDAFADFHLWKAPERILELACLAVALRPGYPEERLIRQLERYRKQADRITTLSAFSVNFSATEIRRRAAAGISFRYQTAEVVEGYILEHRLYRG